MESLWLRICMLFFLVQFSTGFSLLKNNINTSMNHHLCHEDERQLLLQLKQQLFPSHPERYYKTKYWNGSRDCCEWDGVICDYFTGHVISLDLSYSFFSTKTFLGIHVPSTHDTHLSGNLNLMNGSLFHFAHLRNLNLANNDLTGSTLPSEFGLLNELTHLSLSHTNVGGEIPIEFYNLSNLVSLDLASSDIMTFKALIIRKIFGYPPPVNRSTVSCDVKMLLGNMTRLRVLRLTGQNLSNSELPMNMSSFLTYLDLEGTGLQGNLPATLFEKPNLQILKLSRNPGLEGSLPRSLNWSNVHSIKELNLSGTGISGKVLNSIGLMTNLNYLDLSHCRFSGPIPESIGNITAITFINLSGNDFSGGLPSTISNLRHLTQLILSQIQLEGQIPDAISVLQNLTILDLSNNYLQGRIPSSLTNISQLQRLDISSNALTGPFPSTPGHGLQDLFEMDFSNNSIRGTIPPWLFTLPSLTSLDLSSNKLTGRIGKLNSQTLVKLDLSSNGLNIELESFYNITNIQSLTISYNTVTEHDGDNAKNVTFPYLERLSMSSCEIKEFPDFLRSNMPRLYFLDLSHNFLTYMWYQQWQGLLYLDLHSNSLRGTFPSSICNMTYLAIINLSHNKLSGNIPECLANSTFQLQVLDLRRNEFHGKIPTTIGAMHQLANLGLNGNHLQGPLPPSLANCTNLEVIDLGNNMLQDTFPRWLHTLPELKILILKSNNFHGSIATPAFTNNSFTNLQIFDLSYNNFTGLLPEKLFSSLEAIKNQSQASPNNGLYMESSIGYQLSVTFSVTLSLKGKEVELTKVLKIFNTIDLSSNNFEGSIPESISYLTSLRLLNLSHNSIHGVIPPELGRMTNLEQLDLSSNQLTGGIPQSLTNLTFLGDLDLSHNHLVGPIPKGNQFSTFSNESYADNSGLCGFPLTRSCGNEKELPSTEQDEEDEDDDGFMMGFTWKTVVIGYGCGIVLGFILGNILISIEKPRWLTRFVYVEAAIILRRRKKRRRRRVVQGAR